jgi:hypothetical protein
METGYITIEQEIGGIPTINAQLINGTLWLTKSQMADLFGAFTRKIEGCLKTGFISGILVEKEVCGVHRNTDKQGGEFQTVFYNLEAFIYVCYGIAFHNAAVIHRWVTSAIREHLQTKEIQQIAK